MKIKFVSRIEKIIKIACQECCLKAKVSHTYVARYCLIQTEIPLANKNLLMETKIKNKKWDKNIDIWIKYPSGDTGLHQCHITNLIDAIMKIKKSSN
jgi:hypothetical protein